MGQFPTVWERTSGPKINPKLPNATGPKTGIWSLFPLEAKRTPAFFRTPLDKVRSAGYI